MLQRRQNMTEQHLDDFEGVKAALPDDEMLYDLAELYKIFGDTTRIKLLYILFEGEMCVQHMAELLSVSQSAVSHQLRILKGSRLVRYRREGKTVYYSLADDHVRQIIECGTEHINE
ncbi:MAG: helix-turn-helix transcriptional regulator [Clostridia bacterium]|nr:helix-turn-helix transcriptional regulator [Clostridia bacterium]